MQAPPSASVGKCQRIAMTAALTAVTTPSPATATSGRSNLGDAMVATRDERCRCSYGAGRVGEATERGEVATDERLGDALGDEDCRDGPDEAGERPGAVAPDAEDDREGDPGDEDGEGADVRDVVPAPGGRVRGEGGEPGDVEPVRPGPVDEGEPGDGGGPEERKTERELEPEPCCAGRAPGTVGRRHARGPGHVSRIRDASSRAGARGGDE